ncbi:DUF2116 family Zn-ribbon domain-containing protein [Candidatus Bathyarchaeota archaeon]|nr:DUF2116 family Zn-ribbon domain-containing protein [Candidatus Bathyarchaeota archaeon]
MKTKCSNCGKEVERKPSHIKKYVYCSRRCMYEHRRRMGIWKAGKCRNCGVPIRKGRQFCSQSCNYRYMWKTKWTGKRKERNGWMPAKKKFATIILRVPNPYLTNFEISLRELMRQFSKEYGALCGKPTINILGERRLIPTLESEA